MLSMGHTAIKFSFKTSTRKHLLLSNSLNSLESKHNETKHSLDIERVFYHPFETWFISHFDFLMRSFSVNIPICVPFFYSQNHTNFFSENISPRSEGICLLVLLSVLRLWTEFACSIELPNQFYALFAETFVFDVNSSKRTICFLCQI